MAKKETREECDHEQTVHCHDYALAAGIAVGLCWSNLINAQPAAYSTKQVFMTDLVNLPGQEVLIFSSDWQPGFKLPLHIHPDGHGFVFVIEGEQTFEVEGTGTKIVTAGGVFRRKVADNDPTVDAQEPSSMSRAHCWSLREPVFAP